LITRPDDDPDLDPDDPLAVILRPTAEYLGPPPGRYEAIRRGATRRKLLRAAVGTAVACGVAAAVLLPLRLTTSEAPVSPTVPLAPPPASSPAPTTTSEPVGPTPSPSPSALPSTELPTESPVSTEPSQAPTGSSIPTTEPSDAAEPDGATAVPSTEPSEVAPQ
jgi:hypothetical protein